MGDFYFMYFRFTVLSLCVVILAWNYYSLESSERNKQSHQQSVKLGHRRVLDKRFSLHRTIMPTTEESEEIVGEERILELKREKRSRKTAVTKTRHSLERLTASGEDTESIQAEIESLWKALEECLAVMDGLQGTYLRLGDNENKKSVAEEADGLEKEVNDVIEKAKQVVKNILEKKHAAATEESSLYTPPPKSPAQ